MSAFDPKRTSPSSMYARVATITVQASAPAMRRREFITLVGGAAMVWPLAVRAQQGDRMRRIGVLLPATADDPRFQTFVGAFLQEMQNLGWSIGRNVRIDTRWATGDTAAIR